MRIGIIAPIELLEQCCITDVQYVLPSLLVVNETYRKFYIKRAQKGNTMILDTVKVGWRREPETLQIIKQALQIIKPAYLILPSYMFDYEETLKVAKAYLEKLGFGVPCLDGTDQSQAKKFIKSMPSQTYAIPHHFHSLIRHNMKDKNIIYLDNSSKVEELRGREGILVTSFPVRLGLQGRLLSNYKPYPPTLTYFEEARHLQIIRANIQETLEAYSEV